MINKIKAEICIAKICRFTVHYICSCPLCIILYTQVPNRPGQAFIMQGSRNYSPGVFPQLLEPINMTDGGEVYIMNTGERVGNYTQWKRVLVGGAYPSRREGAIVTTDVAGGVVYLMGGRSLAE